MNYGLKKLMNLAAIKSMQESDLPDDLSQAVWEFNQAVVKFNDIWMDDSNEKLVHASAHVSNKLANIITIIDNLEYMSNQ